jgi:hypothetical protein
MSSRSPKLLLNTISCSRSSIPVQTSLLYIELKGLAFNSTLLYYIQAKVTYVIRWTKRRHEKSLCV